MSQSHFGRCHHQNSIGTQVRNDLVRIALWRKCPLAWKLTHGTAWKGSILSLLITFVLGMFAFNAQNVIDNSNFEVLRTVLGHVQSHFELVVILFDFYHLQQKFVERILDTPFLTLSTHNITQHNFRPFSTHKNKLSDFALYDFRISRVGIECQ